MKNKKCFYVIVSCLIIGQMGFSQTYQSEDNGRDGLVVSYDISYSFQKQADAYLAIRMNSTPKSIQKITYLGKVYRSSDFPPSIIQSLMTAVATTRPKVNFELYNGGTFLTNWTSREHSFTINWTKVFNHQSTGDYKTNTDAMQKLNKQGQAMVDAGGLKINVTAIDNVLFNTMLLDNYFREKRAADIEKEPQLTGAGTNQSTSINAPNDKNKSAANPTNTDNDFWSDKPKRSTSESSAGTRTSGTTGEEKKAADQKAIDDMMVRIKKDQQATNQIYKDIDRKADMYRQNFYHAQAVQSGKENLQGLSRLEGNYNSVQELEAEFNQKYNSIRGEVNSLEQARNAQLNNAVTGTFNGNSTEQAIGQGMQIIGSMINNAKAAKERKEAQEALKLERNQQLAAMAATKTRARTELRTKLMQSFPNGGTPLSSHKVTVPEVYFFAYVSDNAGIYNPQALVSVSNVFPVQQYSDGTYPYKTTVLNKLKGYAVGDITLVGYYADKARAEQMRNAFIKMAAKSELTVKDFTVRTLPGASSTGSKSSTGDFWETGKKPLSDTTKTRTKPDFWNN